MSGPDPRGHVLVVEDNPANQVLTVRLLGLLGYTTELAVNGREALEALERRTFGAVVMDCHLPEMDGFEATAELRRREGGAAHTPVIAMTAAVVPEDRERCLAAGMDDFIAKPVSLEEVRSTLARWLPGREATEAPRPDLAEEGWGEARSPLFARLLEAFLATTPRDLARLRAAVGARDADAVQRAAHHLNGGALMFGLEEMAATCRELELQARAGALGAAGELLDRLEQDYGTRRSELQAGSAPTLPSEPDARQRRG